MAIFGLPGGSELLVIGVVVLLLFFPGALLVWIGWVLGRRSAGGGSRDGAAAPPEPGPDATRTTGRDTDDMAESDHGD